MTLKLLKYLKGMKDRLKFVSERVGTFIIDLKKVKIIDSMKDVQFAGSSLGAQAASHTSYFLRLNGEPLIDAIFGNSAKFQSDSFRNLIVSFQGLDPAGPGFKNDPSIHLSHLDADYVQTIHTSECYGTKFRNQSHSSIIVEGGKVQPGCRSQLNFMCNHGRAYFIFKAILLKQFQFMAHTELKPANTLQEFFEFYYRPLQGETYGAPPFDLENVEATATIVGIYNEDRHHGQFHLLTCCR